MWKKTQLSRSLNVRKVRRKEESYVVDTEFSGNLVHDFFYDVGGWWMVENVEKRTPNPAPSVYKRWVGKSSIICIEFKRNLTHDFFLGYNRQVSDGKGDKTTPFPLLECKKSEMESKGLRNEYRI